VNREPVIDADGHVLEFDREIFEYLPPPYQGQPTLLGYPFFPTLDGWHRAANRVTDKKGMYIEQPTPQDWLNYLDEANIAATVLFPTNGLGFGMITDTLWAVGLARGYNDWLHDRWLRANPRRLKGIALIPVQEPLEAVRELRRVVKDLGMVGGILPAVGLQRAYGVQEFWPLYEAAQELDCVLAVHGAPAHNLGLDRFQKLIEVRTLAHGFSQMIHVTSMIFNGVFDAFPDPRIMHCECASGWWPYLAERLDLEHRSRGAQAPRLKRRPSEHLQSGRIFTHCELDELGLVNALQWLPEETFFCASDYPHEQKAEFPEKVDEFMRRQDLPDGLKRKILWDNPIRMYKLDEAELRAAIQPSGAAVAG